MAMIRANVMGLSAETLPRSDRFVRSLAQQLGEIRSMLEAVFDEPESEEVRQRLTEVIRVFCAQAVKAGDRVLVEHFNACDAMLQQVAVFGQLDAQDAEMLSETFERIADHVRTELACEITPTTGSIKTLIPATGKVDESELIDIDPVHVLIVAPPRVVDGLVLDHDQRGEAGPPLAIEQVSDVISAREVVRALGPEVMVVDTALDGAQGFVESLVNDALTNAIPIVALGDWSSPEEAAPFIALGVARHLHKPVSPRSLRRTLNELSPGQANGFDPMAAGTLDEISARLADELHRGLCDAAPEEDRLRRIDVGDGSELLATMWTAVGRLREHLSLKAGGDLHFATNGPEQAVLSSPWLGGDLSSRLVDKSARGAKEGEQLESIKVLVAESDLSMNWFVCGLLRDAGATVLDVADGPLALVMAYQSLPDLILCDLDMPGFDGLQLCRAIRDDIVLGQVPFVLMSDEEERLQRAHELGASADAFLRKESSGEHILKRLLDLSVPLRRVTERLSQSGRVRGRLSGISAYGVIERVCRYRPMSRMTFTDASRTFEVEVRHGAPVSATMTDVRGETTLGEAAFDALLSIGMARFDVQDVPDFEIVNVELGGSLEEITRERLARVRAAQRVLTGRSLIHVQKVEFVDDRNAVLTPSMPQQDRSLLEAFLRGESPRACIMSGLASALRVEAVLNDAARRGVVVAIHASSGDEVLGAAIDAQLRMLQGGQEALNGLLDDDALVVSMAGDPVDDVQPAAPKLANHGLVAKAHARKPVKPCSHSVSRTNTAVPPAVAIAAAPIVDVGEHVTTAPLGGVQAAEGGNVWGSASEALNQQTVEGDPSVAVPATDDGSLIIDRRHCTPMLATARLTDEPDVTHASERLLNETPILSSVRIEHAAFASFDDASSVDAPGGFPKAVNDVEPIPVEPAKGAFPKLPRLPRPSAYVSHPTPKESKPSKSSSRFAWPALCAVVGIGLAVVVRWGTTNAASPEVPSVQQTKVTQTKTAGETPKADKKSDASKAKEGKAVAAAIRHFPLTDEERAKLGPNEGIVEIVVGKNHSVSIDGEEKGRGPVLRVPLKARKKSYEVRVTLPGEQRVQYVHAQAGKRTRVRVAPPWSR